MMKHPTIIEPESQAIRDYVKDHVLPDDRVLFWDLWHWTKREHPMFKFDGASWFPDQRNGAVWIIHDIGYFLGGSESDRTEIDKLARRMLVSRGRRFIGWIVFWGLRIAARRLRRSKRRFTYRTDHNSWTKLIPRELMLRIESES